MDRMSSFSSLSSLNSRVSSSTSKTQANNRTQLRTNAISSGYSKSSSLLVKNILINPLKNPLESVSVYPYMKDYIQIKNIKLNEFDSYCWPILLQGSSLVAVPNKYVVNTDSNRRAIMSKEYLDQSRQDDRDTSLSYLLPLVSALLVQMDMQKEEDLKQLKQTGYIKACGKKRATNGPVLLIVCGSCRNAQRIHEILTEMIDTVHRARCKDHAYEDNKVQFKKLKSILLQGGGYEDLYDAPLANGCDILICSTPFILLRCLGLQKTNLDRVEMMVFDESHLLVERFPKQLRALMACYSDMLNICIEQTVAQFVLFSSQWSSKLKAFVQKFIPYPAYVFDNKLESAYFGQAQHIVDECDEETKLKKVNSILKQAAKLNKNTVVFTPSDDLSKQLSDILTIKLGYANVCTAVDHMNEMQLNAIQTKWANWHTLDKSSLIEKKQNLNLILVCTEHSIRFISISNAKCIINWDFPSSRNVFGNRLWLMRDYFDGNKKVERFDLDKSSLAENTSNLAVQIKNDTEIVVNDEERLVSYSFVTRNEKSYSDGFLNFLRRTGYPEQNLPNTLLKMCEANRFRVEEAKKNYNLCPDIKSFGRCMEYSANSCKYRHRMYADVDQLKMLDLDKRIPDEGFIKFKVCHVEDTNRIYINILSHQDLKREKTTDFDRFLNFDLELQAYYSNLANIVYNTECFNPKDLYAYRDITTTLVKRIRILDITKRDSRIVYECLVQCIDYGVKLVISVYDLIKLPDKFKHLPAQAVEAYFCDIRPMDRDLNYSTASKCFIAEKLVKSKEFVGKIQLAAGDTLWLHPVSSFKHLNHLNLSIIDDCVRNELVKHNFATNYPHHLVDLKKLFAESGLKISKQLDDDHELDLKITNLLTNLYENYDASTDDSFTYAFLNKQKSSQVYVTAVESPECFYVQNTYSYELLERLNEDIRNYLENVKSFSKEKLHTINEEELQKQADLLKYTERLKQTRLSLTQQTFNKIVNQLNKKLYCIARLKRDQECYRAEIVEANDANEFKVYYVDYGDYCWVRCDDIYPLSDKLVRVLPFQAIKCSLHGVLPIETTSERLFEQGDKLWQITHDSQNIHHNLTARVVSESTETNLKCFNLKQKTYEIQLFKRVSNLPGECDIAHELVTYKLNKLTPEEEQRIFVLSEYKKVASPFGPIAYQFVVHFIHNYADEQKQSDYLQLLESRSATMQCLDTACMISIGLIQTIAQGFFFIRANSDHLLRLVKFLKRDFITKNEKYLEEFVKFNGLNNLILILYETSDETLASLILDLFADCFSFEIFKENLRKEIYLRSLWYLIDYSIGKSSKKLIDKQCELLLKLSSELADTVYSSHLNKLIKNVNLKFNIEFGRDEKFELMSENYLSYIEMKMPSSEADLIDDLDESLDRKEMDEKMKRVFEFIQSTSKYDLASQANNNNNSNANVLDSNNNSLILRHDAKPRLFEGDLSPPNSSDESVQEMFEEQLANLMLNSHLFVPGNRNNENRQAINYKNDYSLFENKPYKYPRIEWDQRRKQICMRVFLNNLKEMQLNYTERSISFRANLNRVEYGFDLDFYAEIVPENSKVIKKDAYTNIYMEKKVHGEWPRLLATNVKAKFIRSVYDNIKNSSSDNDEDEEFDPNEEKKKKKPKKQSKPKLDFNEVLGDRKKSINHGALLMTSSDTKTDSESDFDDNIYNDVADSKDIFWD